MDDRSARRSLFRLPSITNGRTAPEGQRRCAGSLSVILRPADSPVSHRLKRSVEVLIRVSVREPRSLITEPNLICRLGPSLLSTPFHNRVPCCRCQPFNRLRLKPSDRCLLDRRRGRTNELGSRAFLAVLASNSFFLRRRVCTCGHGGGGGGCRSDSLAKNGRLTLVESRRKAAVHCDRPVTPLRWRMIINKASGTRRLDIFHEPSHRPTPSKVQETANKKNAKL